MRTAEDIIRDYRKRGYSDERLRALANGRPEPVRSQMLELLGSEPVASPEPVEESVVEPAGETPVIAETDVEAEEVAEIDDIEIVYAENEDILAETASEAVAEVEADVEEILADVVAAENTADATAMSPEDVQDLLDELTDMDPIAMMDEDETSETETEAAPPVVTNEAAEVVPMAKIAVERISVDEYFDRAEVREEKTRQYIDLRMLDDMLEDDLAALGECWPTVASVEQASHAEKLSESESSAILACNPEEIAEVEGEAALYEDPEANKAAQRSLRIIQEAMEKDPTFENEVHQSGVIEFHAPYAMDQEALSVAADLNEEADISMTAEESALIRFPSEMIHMYDAINSHMDAHYVNRQQKVFDENALSLDELEARALDAAEDEAAQEWEQVTIDAFLEEAGAEAEAPAVSTAQLEADAVAAISDKVEKEIADLRNWLVEVEDALKLKEIETDQLTHMLDDRDETLQVQNQEIARLREEVALKDESEGVASVAEHKYLSIKGELDTTLARMQDWECELNTLKTETVPNLLQDKDDLQSLLEDQSIEFNQMRDALAGSQKRASVGYALAAACLFLMMVPVLYIAGSGPNADLQLRETEMLARIQEAEQNKAALEADRVALQQELASVKMIHENEVEIQRQKLRDKEQEVHRLRGEVLAMRAELDTAQDALASGAQPLREGQTGVVSHQINRNTVQGVDAWRQQNAAQADGTVAVRVQSGEGLSDVLWRKLGTSGSPQLWERVARMNNLSKNARGHYLIFEGQQLKLPAPSDVNTASTE